MKEILWDLAETSFRFELLALDSRASGLERPDECKKCFAGGMLMGMDIGLAKQGLASMSPAERHPYILHLARLMCDWSVRPRAPDITEARVRKEWSHEKIMALEYAVTAYYTQSFYNLFGRAAVIPMRITHEFGL
ncbi:hypothetical protein C8J57DRAFT_1061728 [Mycena rebaudengoi]|nr:hypothetical protein C8J57DRAFT_1061728 [Mycena rebaudengoi]